MWNMKTDTVLETRYVLDEDNKELMLQKIQQAIELLLQNFEPQTGVASGIEICVRQTISINKLEDVIKCQTFLSKFAKNPALMKMLDNVDKEWNVEDSDFKEQDM
jgi:hypothetical protein